MVKRTINSELFEEAKEYLVGGVDSPVRAFNYAGCDPVVIKRGRGSKVYDHDGNEYVDYVLSWGSLILGHARAEVVKAVREAVEDGLSFGATNRREVELAKSIRGAIPFAKKVRFVNSGTEAVMGAVRLARGYTSREKIVKFANAYHGHADYLLAKSGSGLATLGIPSSAGVPREFTKSTIVAPLGDVEAIGRIFKRYGREIAAVLVEPAGGNYGVLPPDEGFLRTLRKLTAKHGALLVFDEVITGFRFGFGSIAQGLGIIPDLITLGKIIGGGLPIGAYGGSENIMKCLAPCGKVYQASTFAGNPVTMQAGLTTLKILERSKSGYSRIEGLARYLVLRIREDAGARRIALDISRYGSMFSIKFEDVRMFRKFYRIMLEDGVYFAPSEFEANFLSFSHTIKDIEKTVAAAGRALERIS